MAGLVNEPWISAVEAAWSSIRSVHHDVPAVRLALGHQASRIHRWAHFAATEEDRAPELFLSYAAQTQLSPERLMGVLVHEAVHAIAASRKVRECSSQGRWHNDRFHHLAAETGLMLSPGRAANLGADQLNPTARHYYRNSISRLGSTTAPVES